MNLHKAQKITLGSGFFGDSAMTNPMRDILPKSVLCSTFRMRSLKTIQAANVQVFAFATAFIFIPAYCFAQSSFKAELLDVQFGPRKVFFMLFLMLGPIKVLVPFVALACNGDARFRRRIAARAILFSITALALAGFLGRAMLENLEISIPVLAMTGGIILFIVALRTILQQSGSPPAAVPEPARAPDIKLALTPLAFPTIVTPYGIAAVIVFATLASSDRSEGLVVAAIVLLILMLDWIAMLFAEVILKFIGTSLQVFAVVLGVTQAALGLQIIVHSVTVIR